MDDNLKDIYIKLQNCKSEKELIKYNLTISTIINNKFMLIYKILNNRNIITYHLIKYLMNYLVKMNIKQSIIYKFYGCDDIDYYNLKNAKIFKNFIYYNTLPYKILLKEDLDNLFTIFNVYDKYKIILNIPKKIVDDVEDDLNINKTILKYYYEYRDVKLVFEIKRLNNKYKKRIYLCINSNLNNSMENPRLLDIYNIK